MLDVDEGRLSFVRIVILSMFVIYIVLGVGVAAPYVWYLRLVWEESDGSIGCFARGYGDC
jgi:hypothetical protein